MLSKEQRDEGRRLLEATEKPDANYGDAARLEAFLFKHRDALLAEPGDAEAIKREAVREFAEDAATNFESHAEMLSRNARLMHSMKQIQDGVRYQIRTNQWKQAAQVVRKHAETWVAAARGVELTTEREGGS